MMKNMKNAVKVIIATFVMIIAIAGTASAAGINKKSVSLYQESTVQLSVAGAKKVTWASSKKTVATVSASGVVKGIKAGTATIAAKVGKTRYTCKVTVKKLAISKTTATLKKGATLQLTVPGAKSIAWATSNKSVATVSSKGKVKGIKAGTAKICAKVGNTKFYCTVTVDISGSESRKETTATKVTAADTTGIITAARVPVSTSTAAAKAMTAQEAAVYSKLIAMKASYPEGKKWTNDNYYAWKGGTYRGGYGCAGFAFIMSDTAFGSTTAKIHTNFSSVKVGDIIRTDNNTHSVIVMRVLTNGSVEVAEGNYNSSIHWGRVISLEELNTSASYVMTRY